MRRIFYTFFSPVLLFSLLFCAHSFGEVGTRSTRIDAAGSDSMSESDALRSERFDAPRPGEQDHPVFPGFASGEAIELLQKNISKLRAVWHRLHDHDTLICSKLEDLVDRVDDSAELSESCCEETFSRLEEICSKIVKGDEKLCSKIEKHDKEICSKVNNLTSITESCCEGTFSRLDDVCSKIEDHGDQLCSKVSVLTSVTEECCEETFSRLDDICSKVEDHDDQMCSKVDGLTDLVEECCEIILLELEEHDETICSKLDALTDVKEDCCQETHSRLDVICEKMDQGGVQCIDFEEFATGTIMNDAAFSCVVLTTNDPSNHPLMIFDTANPTGNDSDLGTPHQDFSGPGVGSGGASGQPGENNTALGKVLIISTDGDTNDPDDYANGGDLIFTFTEPVVMSSVTLVDIDSNNTVINAFNSANDLIHTVNVANLGDNSVQKIPFLAAGVSKLVVAFDGSGAVAEVCFCKQNDCFDQVMHSKICVLESKLDNLAYFIFTRFIIRQ